MYNVAWGMISGWMAATGVAVFPVVLTALRDGELGAFDDFGGVGRYVLWCYAAGTLGGATVGVGRRLLKTPIGLALIAGLVTTEAFASQVVMLWDGVDRSTLLFLVPMFFVVGAAMSPLGRMAFANWPDVDRFLGRTRPTDNPDGSRTT